MNQSDISDEAPKTLAPSLQLSLAGIGLTGLATLLFEILLTRIFSLTMWYHFAFVAISLALFGVAASGAAVTVFQGALSRERTLQFLGWSSLGFAFSIPFSFVTDLHIPFLPFDTATLGHGTSLLPYFLFFLKFLVLSLPFFFSGLVIAAAFANVPERINGIYFADLAGGGLGCFLVVPILLSLSGPSAVILASAFPLLAAALFFRRSEKRNAALASLCLILCVSGFVVLNEKAGFIQIRRIKSYQADQGQEVEPPKVFERWHPVSRVAVFPLQESGGPWFWFFSRVPSNGFPAVMEVTNDGGARTYIFPYMKREASEKLFRMDDSDIQFSFLESPRVLVIGVGGGKDILSALSFGASNVTGVELNPIMIQVTQREFSSFSGSPYGDPRVRIVIDEGRNFVASHKETYDLIKLSGTDTWAASAAGAYALSENYLYTREAIQDYLRHLRPGGVVSITRWYPRETLRLVVLAADALRSFGCPNPGARIMLVRNASESPTMNVLLKNGDFTPQEVAAVTDWAKDAGHILVYAPGQKLIDTGNVLDAIHRRAVFLLSRDVLTSSVPINITPPTDDRPFFFNLINFSDAQKGELGTRVGFGFQHARALVLLLGMLKITLVVSVLFVLSPLLFLKKKNVRITPWWVRLTANLYFLVLGVGYLLVEIPLVQRFILFLGHPIYALTVVLFSMLVFSGIGSLLAYRLPLGARRAAGALFLAVVLTILLAAWVLPGLVEKAIGLPIAIRIVLSVLLIAPVGLLLGVPFPTGLRVLHRINSDLVPWAWAVNGVGSVAAPVIATIVAISLGFSYAHLLGALVYAVAAPLLLSLMARVRTLGVQA